MYAYLMSPYCISECCTNTGLFKEYESNSRSLICIALCHVTLSFSLFLSSFPLSLPDSSCPSPSLPLPFSLPPSLSNTGQLMIEVTFRWLEEANLKWVIILLVDMVFIPSSLHHHQIAALIVVILSISKELPHSNKSVLVYSPYIINN